MSFRIVLFLQINPHPGMIKTDSGQYSNKEMVDVLNNYLSRIFNISQEYLPQPYAVGKYLELMMFSTFFQVLLLSQLLRSLDRNLFLIFLTIHIVHTQYAQIRSHFNRIRR